MSSIKIQNLPTLDPIDAMKLPTGGFGDYAVTIGQIADHFKLNNGFATKAQLDEHINNKSNPHEVTKDQIGLGNVDNISDENKPISIATQQALNTKADISTTYNKTETDALLAERAAVTSVYRKDETYSKLEVDDKVETVAGGYFKAFDTLANLQAATGMTNGQVAKVMSDPVSTNNGDYYYNGTSWIKGYDSLTEAKAYVDSFDSLTLNKGNVFPNKVMSRDGTTSAQSTTWNNLILDARVINADSTKYYQIAYQQNGATINGKSEYNWIIYEFDKATFNSASAPVILVNYTDAGQQQLVKNGTVQTITLKSLVKTDLSFTITCDTSALPAGTAPITSIPSGNAAWSFIIDPSRYFFKDASLLTRTDVPRDWLVNKGPYYPFVQSAFNGSTSAAPTTFLNVVKDFQVINAAVGYYYQLAYYTNGSTATGPDRQERWIIHKRPRTGYTDTGATQEQIVTLTIPQDAVVRSGGIEKVRLVSSGQELFDVTLDTSKLPTYGTFMSAANTSDAGYSWYMSPVNYSKSVSSSSTSSSFNSYVIYTASTQTLQYRYRSKDRNYEVVFGPNGANSLPNFKSISSSTNPDLTGTFSLIQAFSTDWLPPLVFYAVNNPDDSNISSFTGGNHASNGDATGDPTATNELYSIFIDGNVLNMAQDFSGACNDISIKLVHKIMASNTKTTSKRYCLKQIFDLNFEGSNMDVHCKLRALEDIRLRSDYGPQLTTQGFQTSQLMLESQQVNRVSYDVSATSGVRTAYPKAFSIIMKGTGGILASWIDRSYGNGTPENCAPDQPLIRGGGGTNHKFYHCAFRSMLSDETAFPPLLLIPTNKSYMWRGGYVIQSDNSNTVYDSTLRLNELTSVINGVDYF